MSLLMKLAEVLRDIAEELAIVKLNKRSACVWDLQIVLAGRAKMRQKILSPWSSRLLPNIPVFQAKRQHSL